jgi:hypothetical protein
MRRLDIRSQINRINRQTSSLRSISKVCRFGIRTPNLDWHKCSTSAVSDNYFQNSVTESRLGLEQCSFPCETEIPVCTAKQDLTGVAVINYDDPARWPVALNSAIRDHIVLRSVCAKINNEFIYPRDSSNRCFSNSMYYRKTANGESYLRTWLVYSESSNTTFCIY